MIKRYNLSKYANYCELTSNFGAPFTNLVHLWRQDRCDREQGCICCARVGLCAGVKGVEMFNYEIGCLFSEKIS